jgi:general nucleoside transport system ATP-binding protein
MRMSPDPGPALPASVAIELRDIVKRFPGVVANDGVDLTVRRGTVHAIVGENGAGKSTLMKTLYGAHRPDEGSITVNGVGRNFKSPRDAIDAGIGMVFQHFMLADNFTVWENIVIGQEPRRRGCLDAQRARDRITELGQRYGLDVDPDALIGDLGVGDKQRVEILKVLYRGADILILDEPTAVLVPHEVEELFTSLRELTATGATVIFISHKLDEVLRHADAITVIRAGRTVAEVPDPSNVTAHGLAEMMVGSELPTPETSLRLIESEVRLDVRDLTVVSPDTGRRTLDGVSLRVNTGEIVGIAGVEGNGQTELIEAIMGLRSASGTVRLRELDLTSLSTLKRRAAGVGYVPEDRQRDGLVLTMPLWENAMLGHQAAAPFSTGVWIDRAAAHRRTEAIIDDFDVRTTGPDVPAYTLSGGNQQKLVVGREMTAEPQVLVAANPTRGVDVGAQAVIWDILRSARDRGLATLLVSADLEELIGLSDRLLVMLRGVIVAELDPRSVTPGELGSYMTGARS